MISLKGSRFLVSCENYESKVFINNGREYGIDEIIYKETQKAAYEEQCEQGFVHQEQSNEDYFEGLNDYFDGTMSI